MTTWNEQSAVPSEVIDYVAASKKNPTLLLSASGIEFTATVLISAPEEGLGQVNRLQLTAVVKREATDATEEGRLDLIEVTPSKTEATDRPTRPTVKAKLRRGGEGGGSRGSEATEELVNGRSVATGKENVDLIIDSVLNGRPVEFTPKMMGFSLDKESRVFIDWIAIDEETRDRIRLRQ